MVLTDFVVGGILCVGGRTGAMGNRLRWNEVLTVLQPNTPPPDIQLRTVTEQPVSLDTSLRLP